MYSTEQLYCFHCIMVNILYGSLQIYETVALVP